MQDKGQKNSSPMEFGYNDGPPSALAILGLTLHENSVWQAVYKVLCFGYDPHVKNTDLFVCL